MRYITQCIAIGAILVVAVLGIRLYAQQAPLVPAAVAQAPASVVAQSPEPAPPPAPEQQLPPPAPEQAPAPPPPPAAPTVTQEEGLNVSLRLTIDSVRIVRVDINDDEEELVEFSFNEPVTEVLKQDGFMLIGLDPKIELRSQSAVLVKEKPEAVLVGFKAGTDIMSYALAAAATASVKNRNGEVNVQDSAELTGARRTDRKGPTAGPDLISVGINSSREWIYYFFDEDLELNAKPSVDSFGFYTPSGKLRRGQTVISVKDNVVTVEFAKGSQVQEAARYFVLDRAIRNTQGKENPMRAVGRATSRPELTSVRRVADTIFDYTFDEDVMLGDNSRFLLYTANGAVYQGKGSTRVDGNTVRVFFPTLRYFGSQMVYAAVAEGAVIANDGSGNRNTIGNHTVWISTAKRTGGPDLIDINVDAWSGLVTFVFDADLNHYTKIDDLRAENFWILTSTGDLVRGLSVASVDGPRVMVHFPTGDVKDMRGATVSAGAVTDDEGNPNPLGTVLR